MDYESLELIGTYIILFSIIVIVGQIFNKSPLPISLLLVVTGMILSLIPHFPKIRFDPDVVLQIFLPILVYQISSVASWKDYKKNMRPIALLSIGHIIFITIFVAWVIHSLVPALGWPLAFVLGAVISPPDDVAIVTIAEKIRLPDRLITILQGEGLFNDATALIIFRLALGAVFAQQFSLIEGFSNFIIIIVAETLYGIVLGNVVGEFRLKLTNPLLNMIASLITPFLAYIPSLMLGGCGVLATVVTGLIIGNRYSAQFTPEFRVLTRSVWPTLGFGINCIIFLVVGLNMNTIYQNISAFSTHALVLYTSAVILTVIVGRFVYVYAVVWFLPRMLFPPIRKKDPLPPWQYPFIISWAGMRGGISLAAALAVPLLPTTIDGVNPRDFLIFLVFAVIAMTFVVQGLTLPFIIKRIGMHHFRIQEEYDKHLAELSARLAMTRGVIYWLRQFKEKIQNNPALEAQLKIYIQEYQLIKSQLKEDIAIHEGQFEYDEVKEQVEETSLLSQIIEVERSVLLDLWEKDKVSFELRNKLLERLDHQARHLPQ